MLQNSDQSDEAPQPLHITSKMKTIALLYFSCCLSLLSPVVLCAEDEPDKDLAQFPVCLTDDDCKDMSEEVLLTIDASSTDAFLGMTQSCKEISEAVKQRKIVWSLELKRKEMAVMESASSIRIRGTSSEGCVSVRGELNLRLSTSCIKAASKFLSLDLPVSVIVPVTALKTRPV